MPDKVLKTIKPRKYQQEIFESCKGKNCLVVLPTGIGKTLIGLMLSIYTQKKFPGSKTLFLAPTRPLAEQHLAYFKKHLPELFAELTLFTGKTPAEKRQELWERADIIFSTPQCISNDLRNNLYSLEEVSLLVEDEAHRCFQNYSYTYVAQKYKEQAKNPKILGLTASPGVDKKKIEQIAKNLQIEAIELRTRDSEDVKEYLQELEFEIIKIDFPEELREITSIIKKLYERKIEELKNRKLLFEPPTKTNILKLQGKIMNLISSGNKNFNYLLGASACAQAIKLSHLIELLETQTIYSSMNYIKSMFEQAEQNKSQAVKKITKNPEFNQAYIKLTELEAKKIEHPKLEELKKIIQESIKQNPKNKTIVFCQYRDTIIKICETLNEIEGVKAKIFVGQAKKGKGDSNTGLSQKEQQEIIEQFRSGETNIICATSIAEEGLDIPEVNSVIFYESIPSAIRKIQRCLTKDSKILMDNGIYKNINEIKPFEKVISFNLKERKFEAKKVINVYENNEEEILNITTEKNNFIRLTGDHPFLTKKGYIKANKLKKGERICLAHGFSILPGYNCLFDILPEETYICENKLFKKIIKENNITLEQLQNMLKINKKTLWNYSNKDSIPMKLFKSFLKIMKCDENSIITEIKYIKSRKGNTININNLNFPEFMWLVGIIASDGDLRKQSKIRINRKKPYYTYRFRIYNNNIDILNKAEKIMKKIGLTVAKEKPNTISSNNTLIGLILHRFGLPFGKKSKTLKLSDEFFKLSDEAIKGFLAGLFDGDGNFNSKPCQIRIGTGSKEFAYQLQSILLRLGFLSKIEIFDKNETRIIKDKKAIFTGDFYSVEIYHKRDVKKFLNMKEIVKVQNFNISYNHSKNKDPQIFYVKVKSIKITGKEKVYNLEIEDNNNYVAQNILVHNCGRTGRMMPGKTIILMTKDTLDEIFYYTSKAKEKKMYHSIESIKQDMDNGKVFTNQENSDINKEGKKNKKEEQKKLF